ncbi:MAG: cache domain-containing protein [Pseudomonadota bacterium]
MKLLRHILITASFFVMGAAANAAEHGTREEAVGLVRKAVQYYKVNGKEKTIAEMNNPLGPFVHKDLYVVLGNSEGVVLANPLIPRMIGKQLGALKDVEGMPLGEKIGTIANSKEGKGWTDYFKWPHPITGQIELKAAYVESVESLTFMCGAYK